MKKIIASIVASVCVLGLLVECDNIYLKILEFFVCVVGLVWSARVLDREIND